jgi:hypothetical protein
MIWKQHPVYTKYEASENGDIRRIGRDKIRKPRLDKDGYLRLNMQYNSRLITVLNHKFTYEAFFGKRPKDMTINHKDLDKTNNHISNMEIVSAEDNITHAYMNGGHSRCRPIVINSTEYYSLREAERQTGLARWKLANSKYP